MMVANDPEPMDSDVDAFGASPRVVVVELPWRAARVHEALERLIAAESERLGRPAVSWTGNIREVARVATYRSTHTVSDALAELEEAGLLLRQHQGNGRMYTYYLSTATPAGEPYVIRTAPQPMSSGRDVVRAAGARRVEPLSPASPTHAAMDAAPMQRPMQSGVHFDAPSLSSDRRRQALLHDAAASAAPVVADHRVAPAEARLRALNITPEPDIVADLAALTPERAAWCWGQIETYARAEGSKPLFVRRCIESTYVQFPVVVPAPVSPAARRQTDQTPAGGRRISWGEIAARAATAASALVWGVRRRGDGR